MWIPFPAMHPAANGAVHHGGAGTLLTGLAAGIPQLWCRAPGIGRPTRRSRPRAVRDWPCPSSRSPPRSGERLVSDPGLARVAREVRDEMAAMPHPDEVVDDLVALIR